MDRRQFLLGSGVTVAVAFAGCSARDDGAGDDPGEGSTGGDDDTGSTDGDDGDTVGNSAESDDSESDSDAEGDETASDGENEPGDEGIAETDDLETAGFSGTGDDVVEDVDIEGGLTALGATHDGSGRFSVSLVGPDEETMIRHVGEYNGAVADRLEGGTYRLEVIADGAWELVVSQPRASSGRSVPASIGDDKDDVYGPFSFEGTHTLSGSYRGDGNFIVHVLSPDGDFRELVINEIGLYDGEEELEYSGVGYVAVQADGEWSIDLE